MAKFGSGSDSAVRSGSIGETLPGDKIRRGSIRPTRPSPDLELCGELGIELLELSLEDESRGFSGLVPSPLTWWRLFVGCGFRETVRVSGLDGGTANEQHHEPRRWELRDRRRADEEEGEEQDMMIGVRVRGRLGRLVSGASRPAPAEENRRKCGTQTERIPGNQ